jgi:hypothetical protein
MRPNHADHLSAEEIGWDATRYADMVPKNPQNSGTKASNKKEASLRQRYPPLKNITASMPCIIVDMHGVILTWYLPGILTDARQVSVFVVPIVAENLTPLRMQCWQREKNCARCWRNVAALGVRKRNIFTQERALEVWQIYRLHGLHRAMM